MSDERVIKVVIHGTVTLAAAEFYEPGSDLLQQMSVDIEADPAVFMIDQLHIDRIEVVS